MFSGGWTLAAAEALEAKEEATEEVLYQLTGLVDKSLVAADEPEGGTAPRYRMPEPIRQYGREHLEESGEAEQSRERHAAFFLALAERADPELKGPRQAPWLKRLAGERDNLRAAMGWLLGRGELEEATRLGWALWRFMWVHGHFAEGRRWMEEALLKGVAMPASLRAKALFVAGTMAAGQADYRSAEPLLEESLALFRELGDGLGAAYALGSGGLAAVGQEQHLRGISCFEESADLFLEAGIKWGAAYMLIFSAMVWLGQGDPERTKPRAKRGLALFREVGERQGASVALYTLAIVARVASEHAHARKLFEEGLVLAAEVGDETTVTYCLEGLAGAEEGRIVRAARLWGAAEALLEKIEVTAYPYVPDRSLYRSQVSAARTQLDEAAFEAAWEEGRAMTPEQAVEYALAAKEQETPAAEEALPTPLSRREKEIAGLVARGLTNHQIADALVISERTVETHVSRILKKLGLRSRNQISARIPR